MDKAEIRYFPGSRELEQMSACFSEHEFPRHCHHTYLIEVVTAGVDETVCGRDVYRGGCGDIFFIHPGEVHTGKSVGEVPLEYEAVYPSVRLMKRLAEEVGLPSPPDFRATVVHDPVLANAFVEAARTENRSAGRIEMETVIKRLIEKYALTTSLSGDREEPPAVRQIKDLVKANPAKNHRLEDLAAHCGFSPYHLVRMFKRTVGLPPHEYLHAYRTELAREMLRQGKPAWLASDLLGYADQAHFTRKFRQLVGVSPGQFRRKPVSE